MMSNDRLHQTHAFDMCHYYDKSNVTIMMSLVQLDTNLEGEESEYTVPSEYCVILCVFTD